MSEQPSQSLVWQGTLPQLCVRAGLSSFLGLACFRVSARASRARPIGSRPVPSLVGSECPTRATSGSRPPRRSTWSRIGSSSSSGRFSSGNAGGLPVGGCGSQVSAGFLLRWEIGEVVENVPVRRPWPAKEHTWSLLAQTHGLIGSIGTAHSAPCSHAARPIHASQELLA